MLKEPTLRKVRNRGWEPIAYRTDSGVLNGWVVKRGRKWIHCYFVSTGRKKVKITEERYFRKL